MAKIYVQSITLKRQIRDTDQTKAQVIFDLMDRVKSLALPDGFELSEIEVYSLAPDEHGHVRRAWDED
jgi:hypothetical protein